LGKVAQDGMPLGTSPLVDEPEISPGVTALILSTFRGGMFPEASPFSPWQRAQRRWNNVLAFWRLLPFVGVLQLLD